MNGMKRVNEIWNHPLYQEHYVRLQELEKERKFCRHTMEHFLDVARLAYIFSLERGMQPDERGMQPDREIIYSAALLHDIGRAEQYTRGTPHEEAGAVIAGRILEDCGFSEEERAQILEAVSGHRAYPGKSILAELIYEADKKSRNCFLCAAENGCYWPEEKKNMEIIY